MYGLRTAPASWQKHLADFLTKQGFTRCKTDACLFFSATAFIWPLIWVDDIMIGGPEEVAIANFKMALA
eukprot:2817536-Alexandrium_andersonii.AAC.1